jgi:hypothetical protein
VNEKLKYQTLAELREAYRFPDGDERRPWPLMIDNDHVSADEGDYEADTAVTVFRAHPELLLEEALRLLGIPFEHV